MSYGTLKAIAGTDGERFWVIQASPHIHQRAKRVFPRLHKNQVGRLVLSDSLETCRDLAWFIDRYPLELSADDRRQLEDGAARHREHIASLEQLIDPNYTPPPVALAQPLRDYQAREVQIYWRVGGLLIGDDVGLGKSVAGIGSLTDARCLPAVIVTLSHLTGQWATTEIPKFLPHLNVHVIQRVQPYELPKFFGRGPDVIVTSYAKLASWAQIFAAYAKSIVFDEVQELRHVGSQKHAAARYLCDALSFRMGLSATPIYNYGSEIFNVLNLLRPGACGTYDEFLTEWCRGEVIRSSRGGAAGIIRDPRAFGSWAREQFLIVRHTRRDVRRELPAVQRIVHTVSTDTQALDQVKDSAAELARIILSNAGETARGEKFRAAEELSNILRQATGIAKAPYVAEFVKLLLEAGEKVVLCGWHRAVYDIWADRLRDYKPVFYTGSETPAQKARNAQRFIEEDSCVLLLSLRSGAGLNGLERAASVIVFGELDWSPGAIEQCIGRLNRDGQAAGVLAYFLVADEGADPIISETLGIKREQVEGIQNPDDSFVEELQVDGQHARRLAEDYLARLRGRSPMRLIERSEVTA